MKQITPFLEGESPTLMQVHVWDKISIRMIKLYGKTIAIPLKLTFRLMLEKVCFSMTGKKAV